MRSALSRLLAILLLLSPAIVLGQGKEKTKGQAEAPAQQTSDQTKTTATKHGKARKKDGQSSNRVYEALTISELAGEDPNRWSEKMRTHLAVGGFVTQASKEKNGDIDIRICDNPKLVGMDRAHCIVAKCIPKLPCEVPRIGSPITVRGISRYDAEIGHHWWEIHPVEQVEM